MGKSNDVLPEKDTLKKYLDELITGLTDSAQVNQALSTAKKNAEKQHNINWHWLKQAKRLLNMSETDRAAEIRHMIHYFNALGVNDQIDMFDDVESVEGALTDSDEKELEDA